MTRNCDVCGASLEEGQHCRDLFYQMLYWENEESALGEVHHLMVLCYHLQHPEILSKEGLSAARDLLAAFLDTGLGPQQIRRRDSQRAASGNRKWTVTARPGDVGSYDSPVSWPITVTDIVQEGKEQYIQSVRSWARSIQRVIDNKPTNHMNVIKRRSMSMCESMVNRAAGDISRSIPVL
jgi:hypothetical protein